ncbi:MAG: divergent polysaccharide deacetylase family protein [bacterium]
MGRRKKRGRSRRWGIPALILLGLLGICSVCIRNNQGKFSKGTEYVRAFLEARFRDSFLIPSSPTTPLNEGEEGSLWAQEFDLALRTTLTGMGLERVTFGGSGDQSLLPAGFKRVVVFQEDIAWGRIREIVLGLVHDRGGKIFQGPEWPLSQEHQMTFYLGRKEARTFCYVLVFQRKNCLKAPQSARRKYEPMVALVIDDLGYNRQLAQSLLSLNMIMTVSILPHHPFSKEFAQKAHRKSCEVILHLPMEPHQCASLNCEENTLMVSMSRQKMLSILDSGLRDVPWAKGVNNHMGSLMLEDKNAMRVILDELKSRGLYFLDSRTTPHSIGYELAREMGVLSAHRHVFIDNEKDLDYIKNQIDILIGKAEEHGKAIGIGHLHPVTIQALRQAAPRFKERGIKLVPVSKLVE